MAAPMDVAQQTRMARYHEQIREVSVALGTDLYACSRRSSMGSPRMAEADPMEPWRAELKRSKFAFSDADMKGSLIKGCVDASAPWKAVDESRQNQWQDAKRENKKLKNARLREEEEHRKLHKSLAEAFADARDAGCACIREIEHLGLSQQDVSDMGAELCEQAGGDGEDLELCPTWAGGSHGEAAEDARRGTAELSRAASLRKDELEKRSLLEAELVALENELNMAKAKTAATQQQHNEALQHADAFEAVRQAQLELGFSDVTFHDHSQNEDASRGTIVLGGSASDVDEAMRTVNVEFGKDGQLVAAAPHMSLGLEHEAADAVKHDDIAALLTMTWHKICDPEDAPKPKRPSCGGA